MTNQEIFDKVVTHLITQGERSISKLDNCLYKALNGLKCAVGCLIPDEEYSSDMEGQCAEALYNRGVLDFLGSGIEVSLLGDLQKLHDEKLPPTWKEGLLLLAEKYSLTPPPILAS